MSMIKESEGIVVDYSRQRVLPETMTKLLKLAEAAKLREKIDSMFSGEHINSTEDILKLFDVSLPLDPARKQAWWELGQRL